MWRFVILALMAIFMGAGCWGVQLSIADRHPEPQWGAYQMTVDRQNVVLSLRKRDGVAGNVSQFINVSGKFIGSVLPQDSDQYKPDYECIVSKDQFEGILRCTLADKNNPNTQLEIYTDNELSAGLQARGEDEKFSEAMVNVVVYPQNLKDGFPVVGTKRIGVLIKFDSRYSTPTLYVRPAELDVYAIDRFETRFVLETSAGFAWEGDVTINSISFTRKGDLFYLAPGTALPIVLKPLGRATLKVYIDPLPAGGPVAYIDGMLIDYDSGKQHVKKTVFVPLTAYRIR